MKHSIVPQLCIYTHEKSETGKRYIMENKISFIFLLILFCIFQIWGGRGSMYCLHNQEILGMRAHVYNLNTWGLRQEDCKSKASL